MKESVTKFDFESAFKALDDIDIPVADKGIKANRPALTEIFSRKSKFDSLFEEYYDVSNTEELGDAQEAREAEVAKAKLARIEKIVDLDADSPEDLLTSYVGKYIMQCPQCMTLFYKNKEDIVESEDDSDTVNVGEVCQHCGNESGYTLVGKVGEAEADETSEIPMEEPVEGEDLGLEIPTEEGTENASEETSDELDLGTSELDELDLNIEDDEVEEEKTEEAFVAHTGEALVEDVQDDAELDEKLKAHTDYIEYLRTTIDQEEKALEKADNEQIKDAIQRRLEALKADLDAALPDAVKNEIVAEEEIAVEDSVEVPKEEVIDTDQTEEVTESLTEALHEEADIEVSADEFKELIDSPEFKQPISDKAVKAMFKAMDKDEEKPVEEDVEPETLTEGNFLKWLFTEPKTRTQKADWVLKNALLDYNNVKLTKGKVTPEENPRRFNKFLVIGYKNTFSNGKELAQVPKSDNKDLMPGMPSPKAVDAYADADKIAQGWSERENNGPAFIYLAKNIKGEDARFLCQYYKGKLFEDNVEKYYQSVKKSLEGAIKEAAVKAETAEPETTSEEIVTEEIKASAVTVGMKLKFKDGVAEVIKVEDSSIIGTAYKNITVKIGDNEQVLPIMADGTVVVVKATEETHESLDKHHLVTIMEQLDEIHEESLEKLISDSLVEAYGNVAGYKLTDCEYLEEKLNINGTISFTSGKTRKTTYTFSEAYIDEDNIRLCGLNEKLGLDKKFILTGKIDESNKTFVTEAFTRNK